MPLDYRLAMAEPVQAGGTLRNIMTIGALHDQEREREAQRQAAASQQQARQVLQQVFAQHADDPEQGIVELRRRGFIKEAAELDKELMARKKSILDQRKVEVEIAVAQGKMAADEAERELKAQQANSPDEMLKYVAAATTPDEWQKGIDLMRLKFGTKADSVIATLGDFDPAKAAFAQKTALGPKDSATLAGQEAARQQAASLAAIDDARQDKTLTQAMTIAEMADARARAAQGQTAAYQSAQLGLGRERLALEKQKAATDSATGGVKLSAGAIDKVASVDQSMGMLDDIERLLPKMSGSIGVLDGRVSKAKLATGAGITPELAEFDAQLTGLKNAAIKATTGAAMSEPEAKRIMGQLPDMSQPEAVFKARLATTRKNLDTLKRRTIELSGGTVAPSGATPKADPLGIRK